MSKKLCPTCKEKRIDGHSNQCMACYQGQKPGTPAPSTPEEALQQDRQNREARLDATDLKKRYSEALRLIQDQEKLLFAATSLREAAYEPLVIEPKTSSGTSEATVVTPFSDVHLEEIVGPEVNGLNVYNPEIAERRVKEFFSHSLRLTRLLEQDVRIPTWILPLLGDFITNDIHGAENAEKNAMLPVDAILTAQRWIRSGIDFLLNNTKQQIVIPCHSGNHARTTEKTRFSAENGHSLEFFMYTNLAMLYENEPRVRFILPAGMHSYVQVYQTMVRFHHGHGLKYQGGVGGIYIPVNKAIAQWNKARHADLDVFGHYHQLRDGGNFICNGSVIGYNAFALSIKADYEQPKQALFLIDKKRGRTCMWPILFS